MIPAFITDNIVLNAVRIRFKIRLSCFFRLLLIFQFGLAKQKHDFNVDDRTVQK